MPVESDDIFKELRPENLQREADAEEKAKLGELAVGSSPEDTHHQTHAPTSQKDVARQFWGEDLEETPLPGGYSKLKRSKRFRSK